MTEKIEVRELVLKYGRKRTVPSMNLTSSAGVAMYCRNVLRMHDDPEEKLWSLFLDVRGRVIGHALTGKGGLTSTTADCASVFRAALLANACSVIVSHNHPSGRPDPSREDVHITKQLKDAGALLGIRLLDHVIIAGSSGAFSFADSGML